MRSANQVRAKQDIMNLLNCNSILIITGKILEHGKHMEGVFFLYSAIYVKHQRPIMLQTWERFLVENLKERVVKNKKAAPTSVKEEIAVFECNVPECTYTCAI